MLVARLNVQGKKLACAQYCCLELLAGGSSVEKRRNIFILRVVAELIKCGFLLYIRGALLDKAIGGFI